MAKRGTKRRKSGSIRGGAPHPFVAAFHITSLRNCVKTHLNLTDQDLAKPIGRIFRGQANPVDVLIAELGTGCYTFTPRQVYQKINRRPVATVNDFIKYLGS
jgi:hypothetical protein